MSDDRRFDPQGYATIHVPVAERLSAPFLIAESRTVALSKVQALAIHLQGILQGCGYHGPIAVAGGYVRDVAIGKDAPKDLDVFLDSGYIRDRGVSVQAIVVAVGKVFSEDLSPVQMIPCYGAWSNDIDLVGKTNLLTNSPLVIDLPPPHAIDIIVLRREELLKQGYLPDATSSDGGYTQDAQFLNAVLSRVDLRLNAIGATPLVTQQSAHWDHDVLARRCVVQYERRDDQTNRIEKRLERLAGPEGKFAGWDVLYEGPDGECSVTDFKAEVAE